MQLKAKQEFSWAHHGYQVETFAAGQVFETEDAELVSVSVREGWAAEVKAHKGAPENKAKTKGAAAADPE
jgi:hypothetical protein